MLVRSDQRAIPAGQGQLGFFYDDFTDPNLVNAGFGDGLAVVDPREVSFASDVPGTTLSNNAPRYYTLDGGVEPPPWGVPEPASLMMGAAMAGFVAASGLRQRA